MHPAWGGDEFCLISGARPWLVIAAPTADDALMPKPQQTASRPAAAADRWLLVAMALCAIGCASLATFISTEHWAAWFSHPGQRRPELTRDGALVWRIMLGVTAAMLVMAPLMWMAVARNRMEREVTEPARSRKRPWGLLAIIFIALGVRSWRINESLWYDEIASWMTYAGGAKSIGAVFGNFLDPINHPFHTLLNYLSVKWLTDALGVEMAFRLPALVFSLLSVIAVYGLARAAVSERVGLFAAALAAMVPVSVLEGVEARGYSIMICFAAAASWLVIEARRHDRSWVWALYAAVCALGVWSHFVTAFVPIGHGVWLAWRAVRCGEWREAASGSVALGLGASIALTLYAPMLPAMLASRGMFAAQSATQPTIIGPEGLHALLQMGGSWNWWAAIPGLFLVALGLISIAIKRSTPEGRETASVAVEVAVTGLPLMVIAVALSGTWVYARFMLFALPGAMLLIALGIDGLWRWKSAAAYVTISALALFSVADLAIRPPKQPLRDAVEYIAAQRSHDDRILAIGLAHEVLRIYAHDMNLTYSLRHGADLPQKLVSVRPRWIIVEYPRSVRPETYELILRAGFTRAARFHGWVDWTNGDIVVYQRNE